ncbi:antitoxin [Agromyces sp. SYSU K20354]|uniref:antitoxin n=1 Tax=Agromyces cavernae TaxID=2898659 RepID=UPI001E341EEC|nr:antitoxin [Agromyces cavernae]MCD2441305.1 antitoxin [Agromyces cavernae]
MTKVSISLSPVDLAYVDELAVRYDGNRSAAIHELVRLGRELAASDDYAASFDDWESSGDAEAWESVAADGLGPANRSGAFGESSGERRAR